MGTLKQAVDRVAAAKTAIGNAITAKGGTVAASDGLEEFAVDIATITNQYTSSDEGKVVDNGALVAQTATTVTENGTYSTTTNDSVTVNVPSGADIYELKNPFPTLMSGKLFMFADSSTNRLYIIGQLTFNGALGDFTFSSPVPFSELGCVLSVTVKTYTFSGTEIYQSTDFTISPNSNEIKVNGRDNGTYNVALIVPIM